MAGRQGLERARCAARTSRRPASRWRASTNTSAPAACWCSARARSGSSRAATPAERREHRRAPPRARHSLHPARPPGCVPVPELRRGLPDAAGVPLLRHADVDGHGHRASSPRGSRTTSPSAHTVHGVLVDLLGLGVLILGESGIGKSECALELISRGHRLVADDVVERAAPRRVVRRRLGAGERALLHGGARPRADRRPGAVRRVGGLHDQADWPGRAARAVGSSARARAARPRRRVARRWSACACRWCACRSRPGRSIATLVEVAARNELLKAQGYNAARDADRRVSADADGARRGSACETETEGAHDAGTAAPRRRRGARALHRPHRAVRARASRRRFARSRTSATSASTTCRPSSSRRSPQLSRREGAVLPKVALVLDVREGGFLREFPRVWRQLKATPGLDPLLIFLEASHDDAGAALQRDAAAASARARSARRRRASEPSGGRWQKIRALADEIVDTTHLTVHQLRERFQAFARARGTAQSRWSSRSSVSASSSALPVDADIVFDVRFLPNPHFVPALKPKTGTRPRRRHVPRAAAADRRVPARS